MCRQHRPCPANGCAHHSQCIDAWDVRLAARARQLSWQCCGPGQVIDARDPMGTRSPQLEQHLRKHARHKHLLLLLNKCDLVSGRLPAWIPRLLLHPASPDGIKHKVLQDSLLWSVVQKPAWDMAFDAATLAWRRCRPG